jgi:hypothetical protein
MNPDRFTQDQVLALTACMMSVAHVDGVHQAEQDLIASFYAEQCLAGGPALSDVPRCLDDAGFLTRLAQDREFAETLVRLCLMTGFADGHLSPGEWAHIEQLAARMGVEGAALQTLRTEVKDRFVATLMHLPVAESVADVARSM